MFRIVVIYLVSSLKPFLLKNLITEFDFDVRLKNSIGFPGLYSNGCYRIQVEKRSAMVDCVCSNNKCNEMIPEIETGHVRCYMGKDFRNTSQVSDLVFFQSKNYLKIR